SPAERKAVARKIGEACRNIGFLYLVNHDVPSALIERTFAEVRRFFALPLEKKQEIAIERSPCHRGYFGMGGESLDPKKQIYAATSRRGSRSAATSRPTTRLSGQGRRCTGPINGRKACRAGGRRCRNATTAWSSWDARSCMPSRSRSNCRR